MMIYLFMIYVILIIYACTEYVCIYTRKDTLYI